ncbi:hypothetical protein VB711_20825 [Cronbergia sp. UHCC 0137]|uniref:hypothetical protein n=1 Tax=Cronbergia sp. UHCC 0137 TaxID=3110239 RepID=UPI002B202F4F|nr:hypothetical protein [Cronbergia sp. UHCC 0137]MEA5620271.1 hypothetical protein [Cronbergia sp. UHCC 0137]
MLFSRQSLVTPLVFCFCILVVSLIQKPRLKELLISQQDIPLETLEKNIKAENLRLDLLKKMPTFGFDNFVASWEYLNFLQYFGDNEARDKTSYSLSPEYFEVILKHDPRFLAAYLGLSTSTSLYAGMPERSITLMDNGLKSLTPFVPKNSYYVWRYKGTDELLFLGDTKAAKESFTQAANWANNYPDEESKFAALVSQRTAEFLERNPDSKFARISTWSMVLGNKIDEKTRKRAIREIEMLGGQVIVNPDGSQRIVFPQKD